MQASAILAQRWRGRGRGIKKHEVGIVIVNADLHEKEKEVKSEVGLAIQNDK